MAPTAIAEIAIVALLPFGDVSTVYVFAGSK